MNLDAITHRYSILRAEKNVIDKQLVQANERLDVVASETVDIEKALILVQKAALQTQMMLRVRLTKIVTTALRAVFVDDNLEFDLTFDTKRGRTEAVIEVGENGVFTNPMEGHGGGVVDVVSFALRAAFWSIAQNRPVMVLDEPMKFLSRDLVHNAADMMQMVSKELGLQIIMVTHIQEFIDGADEVFNVFREGNVSRIEFYGNVL